ncbi:MAG: hypothetical protein D6808_05325 [Candidatus Dadabacteria bacterium]|nr:MAG: hypothetical protein D6808_05325 [Candidatus Dadabacteria bacterium]
MFAQNTPFLHKIAGIMDDAGKNTLKNALFWATSLVLLIVATYLRLKSLDKGVLWYDEILSTLRIGGWDHNQLLRGFIRPLREGFLQCKAGLKFLTTSGGGYFKIILNSIKEGYSPLYYITARIWSDATSFSLISLRYFSATTGIFTVAAGIVFGCRLFSSRLAALILGGVLAASPLMVVYSQEIRMYSALCLCYLLSCLCVLKILDNPSSITWRWLYFFILVTGLYLHLLFFLVLIAHSLFSLIVNWKSLNKLQTWHVTAISCLSLVLYAPELYLKLHKTTIAYHHAAMPVSLSSLKGKWLLLLSSSLFGSYPVVTGIIYFSAIAIAAFHPNKKLALFVLINTACLLGFIFGRDMLFGGGASAVPRYMLLGFVSLYIAIAAAFDVAYKLSQKDNLIRTIAFGGIIMLFIQSSLAFREYGYLKYLSKQDPYAKPLSNILKELQKEKKLFVITSLDYFSSLIICAKVNPDAYIQEINSTFFRNGYRKQKTYKNSKGGKLYFIHGATRWPLFTQGLQREGWKKIQQKETLVLWFKKPL